MRSKRTTSIEKVPQIGWYILLFSAPLIPPQVLSKTHWIQVLLPLILILQIPCLIRLRRIRTMGNRIDLFLMIFLLWSALSTVLIPDALIQSLRAYLMLILHVLGVYSLLHTIQDGGHQGRLTRIIILAGCLVAACGLLQYYNVGPLHRFPAFRDRITSTFANPNHLSSYLTIPFLILFVYYFFEHTSRKKTLIYLALLLLYTAILLTGTRGILVASVLSLGFLYGMLAKSRRLGILRSTWPRFLLLYLSIATITLVYSIPIPLNRGTKASRRITSSVEILRARVTKDLSIHHRWLIWSVTAEMIRDHPLLGIGYGAYTSSYASYQARFLQRPGNATRFRFKRPPPSPGHAENEYLHLWAETGLIGFVLFLIFLLKLAQRMLRILNTCSETTLPLFLALSTALLSILIHSLVSYPLHMPATALTFWAIIGWLMSPRPSS